MLDPIGRADVIRTIKQFNRDSGMTVVLITHHMDEAAQADRLVVMAKGKVISDGAPKEVFQDVEGLKAVGLTVPHTTQLLWDLRQEGIEPADQIYTDKVTLVLVIEETRAGQVMEKITALTNGTAQIEQEPSGFYPLPAG
jgi:energy-coupling factor transport system ATP-binding protein